MVLISDGTKVASAARSRSKHTGTSSSNGGGGGSGGRTSGRTMSETATQASTRNASALSPPAGGGGCFGACWRCPCLAVVAALRCCLQTATAGLPPRCRLGLCWPLVSCSSAVSIAMSDAATSM